MMLGKCKNVNVDIINMLLLHGANINDKSKNGETIFDSAVFRIRDIKFMIKKWPVMMGIIIFKHLVMYHELDASTFIDLWEYIDV
jgi:ankyrin repeat protein